MTDKYTVNSEALRKRDFLQNKSAWGIHRGSVCGLLKKKKKTASLVFETVSVVGTKNPKVTSAAAAIV